MIRTRITKTRGPVRTTTSWGSKRGITTSSSYGGNGTRTTISTNQKTGKSYFTQSQKLGKNTWWVSKKTLNKSPRGRKTKNNKSSFIVMVIGFILGLFLS